MTSPHRALLERLAARRKKGYPPLTDDQIKRSTAQAMRLAGCNCTAPNSLRIATEHAAWARGEAQRLADELDRVRTELRLLKEELGIAEADAALAAGDTKTMADVMAEHDLKPVSRERFEELFGDLPSDGEG